MRPLRAPRWQTPRPCQRKGCKRTWLPSTVQGAWAGKYCSKECSDKARCARWRALRPHPPWRTMRRCSREGCKHGYLPKVRHQLYCSPRCRERQHCADRNDRRALLPKWLHCALPECERRFKPHDCQQLYCCEGHSARARARRHLAKVQGKPAPPPAAQPDCLQCGAAGALRRSGRDLYCAERCGYYATPRSQRRAA